VPDHDGESFVLLHLNGTSNSTSHPLDLAIQGTDNVAPYSFTCKFPNVTPLVVP
jgi:hypothetical protein